MDNQDPLGKEVLEQHHHYQVREARKEEFPAVGALLVKVYSALKGFPGVEEQPAYYEMLRNVGELTENNNIQLLVAVSEKDRIGGAVVFFRDMKDYGSGGTATQEQNACGFRLLGVDPESRGLGLGKQLTQFCIDQARNSKRKALVIHTTNSMKVAWKMYEAFGFKRARNLDFLQGKLPVFGLRLALGENPLP